MARYQPSIKSLVCGMFALLAGCIQYQAFALEGDAQAVPACHVANTPEALQRALNRPGMKLVYVRADWDVDGNRLNGAYIPSAQFFARLGNTPCIIADATHDPRAMLGYFGEIGPPVLLLLNAKNQVLARLRGAHGFEKFSAWYDANKP